MKVKTPNGIWALRGVTVAIALLALAVVGTVVYSAYEDVIAVRSELEGGSQQAVGRATLQGSGEVVSINITVPNRGMYTLSVTLTCSYPTSNVVCSPSNVVVPPGRQGVLRFKMTVADLSAFAGSPDHAINGTVEVEMQPFVTLTVGTDFGGFVNTGGA